MKKVKFAFLLAVVSLGISSVKAVNISNEDYNRLRMVFSEARISAMTEEEVDKYLKFDLENANRSTVYYKGVSHNNESYTWTEVTEDEYNNEDPEQYSLNVTTNYKTLSLSILDAEDGLYAFNLQANWKVAPAVRSFDVIGFCFDDIAIISGSQSGTQSYKLKGESYYEHIVYSPNGRNISKQDDGFGISMNLVDDDIDDIELSIDALGLKATSMGHVWGSYQHAIKNVTLAESQQYTVSTAGYGHVINFMPAQANKYDGMRGVDAAL